MTDHDRNSDYHDDDLDHNHNGGRRRNKRLLFWVGLVVIIIAGSSLVAFCFKSAEGHMHWMVGHMEDKFELSDEQSSQLMVMGGVVLQAKNELHNQRILQAERIADIFAAEKFDAVKGMDSWKQVSVLVDKQMQQFVQEAEKFHQMLSPEQRQEIAKKMRNMGYGHRW